MVCWQTGWVKTTVELSDDLMRAVKIRAVAENRRIKDVLADLLRSGLSAAAERPPRDRRRVRVPLVRCAHPAGPDEEVTPERAAAILLDREAHDSLR